MTRLKEYREGLTSFVSADVQHYTEKEGQPTADMPVFYNPKMCINRDISVIFLSEYLSRWDIDLLCEPLAGSGVRTLRYLNECQGSHRAVMFDVNPEAVHIIQQNIEENHLSERATVIQGDARLLLLSESREKRFDFVDVDPFGTPVPYLNAAVQALNPTGALLSLTATDMPALCGVYPPVAFRKYGGFSIRSPISHEIAIRLLLGVSYSVTGANDRSMSPLAVLSTDHYVRVWLRVESSRKTSNRQAKEIGWLRHCPRCMNTDLVSLREGLEDEFNHCRDDCQYDPKAAGPLWIGSLCDAEFVQEAYKKVSEYKLHKKSSRLIQLMSQEAPLTEAPYIDIHAICDSYRLTPPSNAELIAVLTEQGLETTRTHFRPTALRTEASPCEVVRAIHKIKGVAIQNG
ncbi:tRNA (guanine(10)-N(2))-dimethyltransferase [Candidatus Thorarchaeota archaeon]|nr:MAG: tRNA (guanine(10)-N(2))-dimethyltransferase [Candidatus Thorarchaeota archaeon]